MEEREGKEREQPRAHGPRGVIVTLGKEHDGEALQRKKKKRRQEEAEERGKKVKESTQKPKHN